MIFDDLERCTIAINDLLGYFNYFVEHQNLKIVIIADENKISRNIISSEKVQAYDAIKEKVIGKSLTINSEFNDAYHDFIKKYINNDSSKQFLENQLEYVKQIFDSVKSQNLRILKSIIMDFSRIYSYLPQEACEDIDFLKDILKSITILLLEIKLGRLPEKDIINFPNAQSEYLKERKSKSKIAEISNDTKEKSLFSHLYPFFENLKACYSFSISDLLPNYLWWSDFFLQGKINSNDLITAFQTSRYNISEDTDLWQKLYYFENSSDQDFKMFVEQALNKITNNDEFEDLGVFLHIVSLLIFFTDNKIISYEASEIQEKIKQYISSQNINLSNLFSEKNLSQIEVECDERDESYYSTLD